MTIRQLLFIITTPIALAVLYYFAEIAPFRGSLTLVPVNIASQVLLLDANNKVIHHWNVDSPRAYLMENGDLLALHGTHSKRDRKEFKNLLNKVSRYDWSGKEIWSYQHPEKLHHDFAVANDGIYLLGHKYQDGVLENHKIEGVPIGYRLRADLVIKIDFKGHLLWEWSPDPDLLALVGCKNRDCKKNIKRNQRVLDWAHFNSIKIIPPNKYFDQGHKAFRPGNLLIMARNWHQMFILDSEKRQIVWEFPSEDDPAINGGHEASIIPAGRPGEGDILFFENGWDDPGKGKSAVKVINPLTREIYWKYEVDGFYSEYQGSAQRLSNGNTFISSDYQRTCFEIDPQDKIVWSYKADNHIYRCRRYEAGYLRKIL